MRRGGNNVGDGRRRCVDRGGADVADYSTNEWTSNWSSDRRVEFSRRTATVYVE